MGRMLDGSQRSNIQDGGEMPRLNKRKRAGRGQGRPDDITNTFRDAVTTRAMELRMDSYTLREPTEIVNEEFGDTLSVTTGREWIEARIKPELEEKADAYSQHLLDQISIATRSEKRRVGKDG